MTRQFFQSALLVCMLLIPASLAPAAEDILKLVPESASGFVVFNRPAAADAKIQAIGRQMQLPVPSLLALFKLQSGILEGIDENGSAALLVLPAKTENAIPVPIILIPVADYGKFIAQLHPENANDEVTKIKVFGSPSWVRGIGGYAAITDSDNREAIEKTLTLSKEVPAALASWREWLAGQDVGGLIFQPGIKQFSAKVQQRIEMTKSMMAQGTEQMKVAAAGFDLYEKMLQLVEKEVSTSGVGLQIDKQNALRITKRVSLVPDGKLARIVAKVQPVQENLLAGLPEGPFVMAGGGAVPDAALDAMMKFSTDMMKNMPNLYGLSEEQATKMSELRLPSMKGICTISMSLRSSSNGEPIFSSAINMMRVDNSKEFLAAYEKDIARYAEFLKGIDSPMLQPMEIEKSEVGGIPSLQLTTKIPQPPAGQQAPQHNKMMEAMMGSGGKLTCWLVPADGRRVVMGYNKDILERAVESIKQGKPGLAGDAEVSKTAALLPSDAAAVFYLSPSGTIDLVKQILPVLLPPGMEVEIPEFSKTPPIGLAVTTAPNQVQTCLAVPAEVLQAIGQYVGKVRNMHGGAAVPLRPPLRTPIAKTIEKK